ncbi:hypothetical protein LCGC14_2678050 [marine sediment metagenome]|uniref:Uncharacterized protein n=1 Tax=marine sediment metagenome TaxID=412755 RepID=A0A0F9BX22_9ZZZZ
MKNSGITAVVLIFILIVIFVVGMPLVTRSRAPKFDPNIHELRAQHNFMNPPEESVVVQAGSPVESRIFVTGNNVPLERLIEIETDVAWCYQIISTTTRRLGKTIMLSCVSKHLGY